MSLDLRPCPGALGAEIEGLDAGRIDAADVAELRRALDRHMVLFLRGQRLDREQHKAFSRGFGPLCRVPFVKPMADDPDVIAVLKEADETGIANFGGDWHSDFSCLERPPMGSVLYALEVPPAGGDTLWANMCLAYERLPPETRRRLDGLTAIHTGRPYGTRSALKVPNPARSIRIARSDPAADLMTPHPVVRVHPGSGRRALYVNPIYTSHIEGLPAAESKALLATLYRHATRPEFTWRHRWRAGDLVIWDNRVTLHYACNDYDGHRRLLHRTTIAGERPLGPPTA